LPLEDDELVDPMLDDRLLLAEPRPAELLWLDWPDCVALVPDCVELLSLELPGAPELERDEAEPLSDRTAN
jgi:hypothetical protein